MADRRTGVQQRFVGVDGVDADFRIFGLGIQDNDTPIARLAEQMAGELGIPAPAIYISNKETRLLVVEPTNPMSIVISASCDRWVRPS